MSKQHNTFPGEQPVMPARELKPEITRPGDPNEPEIPQENPQREPEEVPPNINPTEDPPLSPSDI